MQIRLHGGGFMFYSISPINNNVYVLLGREAKNQQWSSFSGVARKFETAEEVCAREAAEELMGLNVLQNNKNARYMAPKMLLKHIREEPTELSKIEIYMKPHNDQVKAPRKLHQTLIHQIPWHANIEDKFKDIRSKLLTLRDLIQKYEGAIDVLPCYMQCYCPTHDQHMDQLLTGYMLYEDHVEMHVMSKRRKGHRIIYRIYYDPLYDVFLAHYALMDFVKQNKSFIRQHPAITPRYYQDSRAVVSVQVDDSYLEKDKVAWWSLPMLRKAIHSKGHYKSEKFRRCFLPTLHIFVNNFND